MAAIEALALDVDGVLTDGGIWWNAAGDESKRFSFVDIMGVSLALKAGIAVTLISGEDSPLVDRFAAKMNIVDFTRGSKDKASALRAYLQRHGLEPAAVCFMGDDINDLPAMEIAGFSAAPATAVRAVLERVDFVSRFGGGNGAVREVVDALIAARRESSFYE